MRFTIRPVSALDAEALWEIYAPYTLTPLTYEYPAPDLEEFARRIARVSDIYPYLVCEADGLPVGYAYAHRYRERASYDWDAELSIYLSPSAQGRGIGRALYTALFSLLRVQGFVNVYGCVAAPQPSQRAFARGPWAWSWCSPTAAPPGSWANGETSPITSSASRSPREHPTP